MRLTLLHYGPLRDHRGCAQETVEAPVTDLGDLYRWCGFPLDPASVAVAINDALVPWEHPLADGDTVVFLSPVSGG